jgi:hypothetical protein
MNAPIDLVDIERRTLLARIAELEAGRPSPGKCAVCGELFGPHDIISARHGHHITFVTPPALDRAIRDLLARIERRSDVGADTRLAVEAVRQELHAATSTTSKETER